MAGTMPHAIFMEPDVDGPGTYAAYAAEFPGCAVFSDSEEAAAAQMPGRVAASGAWLRDRGETAPTVIGTKVTCAPSAWYRAPVRRGTTHPRRSDPVRHRPKVHIRRSGAGTRRAYPLFDGRSAAIVIWEDEPWTAIESKAP